MKERFDDETTLGILRHGLAEADPIPEYVRAAAREAILWRTLDAEMAQLVFDSAVDELAGVRSAGSDRQVTFRAPGVEIEVGVMAVDGREITGQLVPPQSATVELRSGETIRETVTDRLGRFRFADVASGSVAIVVITDDGTRIATEWMVV